MVAELRAHSQVGGDILFGTDIGYTDHFDTALEFTLMARAGMNFQQILGSLTTNPRGDSDIPTTTVVSRKEWKPIWWSYAPILHWTRQHFPRCATQSAAGR